MVSEGRLHSIVLFLDRAGEDFVFANNTQKEFRIALNIQLMIFNTVCDIWACNKTLLQV